MRAMRTHVARLLLFLTVIMLGLEMGAGSYETRAVVPVWSRDPQAAYTFFSAHPEFAMHAGERWWIYCTPATTVVAILLLVFAGALPRPQALWARAAGIMAVVLVSSAFFYFVPRIIQLQSDQVLRMSPDQAKALGARWAELSAFRLPWCFAAWCVAIYAISRRPATEPLPTSSAARPSPST